MNRTKFYTLVLAGVVAVPAAADALPVEKVPPGRKVVRLEVQPTSVALKHRFDYRQLLLTAHLDNGERMDATRIAKLDQTGKAVEVSARRLVRPAADGGAMLKFSLQGQSAEVSVKVSGQKEQYEVSFVRDIMPTLSKVGCNAGTCHGAQKGKNGFKLSLRGYDPLIDHRALTDDLGGRRFNRSAPDQSLMLLKTSGGAPHEGGVVTRPGQPYYEILRAWIADGVKLDLDSPRVASIDILPKNPVVPRIGMQQQMAVMATYTDGTVRDVTAEAFVETSNQDIGKADKQGLVLTERRGETAILARFEGAYTATTLIVMGDRTGFTWKDVPTHNYIDELVYDKLKRFKIQPSELCTDGEFIRRVYLDLTGIPPQPEEVRSFMADKRPTSVKRNELIDKLIGSNDYIEYWTNKWADLLQVNTKFLGQQGAKAFRGYIRKSVADNKPYDKFAYDILTASGSNLQNPAASYYKILRKPGDAMENTTHLFLAIRFNCNKCHDHPFERWTQNHYYELSAYFARVGRKRDPKFKQNIGGTSVQRPLPLVEVISDLPAGEVKHERTGVVTKPVFPFEHGAMPPPNLARREQLARWVTSKENPYFARSYVNRVWSYLLGVGIIEPIDDIRAGNPPTNPKLLDKLTEEFISNGFDVRHIQRLVCQSRVYQQSLKTNRWNSDDEINYSHALARRLSAEVLYDAIHRATGSQTRLPGLPAGARATQLLDSNVSLPGGFLKLFGKPPRESACECERSGGMMLGPVLNLVNGPVLADAIKDPNNRLAKLVQGEKDNRKIVREIFLAVLCRYPTEKELQAGLNAIKQSEGEFAQIQNAFKQVLAEVAATEKSLPTRQAAWEKQMSKVVQWTVLEPAAMKARGATMKKLKDNSILVSGKNVTPERYTLTFNTDITGITAIRLEAMTDPKLPRKGPGRAPNGNFVLTQFRAKFGKPGSKEEDQDTVVFGRAIADYSQPGLSVKTAIDGQGRKGWAIGGQFSKPHVAVFESKKPFGLSEGTTITIFMDHRFVGKLHSLGRFRISVTTSKPPISLKAGPGPIVKLLQIPAEKRNPAQKKRITDYYRSIDAELKAVRAKLAQTPRPIDKRLPGVQDLAWALINNPAFLFNH